eukprot:maker-scaffold1255_size84902-snap-gene-0.17 protein:Tk08543 transcript:maker-scaffold1255_size84902-snap-gene-0.17-mRNA-1 annotation:"PREDICTED: uncharacterized protein LOC100901520"
MVFNPKNIIKLQGIPKIVELVVLLVIVLITRIGGPGDSLLSFGSGDGAAFGYMVTFGYFFIVIVQTIGLLFGEEINIQNMLFTVFGVIFFMGMGISQVVSSSSSNATRLAQGSMSIIASLAFMADAGIMAWKAKNEELLIKEFFSPKVNRKSLLDQHEDSNRHKNNLKLHNDGEKATQQLLSLTPASNRCDTIFNRDLVKAVVSANIPLYKIQKEEMNLEKYTKKTIQSSASLTTTMEEESKIMLGMIKEKLIGKSLFLCMDESMDRPM